MNQTVPSNEIDQRIFNIRDTLLKLGGSLDDDETKKPKRLRHISIKPSDDIEQQEQLTFMKQAEETPRFEKSVFNSGNQLKLGLQNIESSQDKKEISPGIHKSSQRFSSDRLNRWESSNTISQASAAKTKPQLRIQSCDTSSPTNVFDRLEKKDKLLDAMTQLQKELYKNVDDQALEIETLNQSLVNLKEGHKLELSKMQIKVRDLEKEKFQLLKNNEMKNRQFLDTTQGSSHFKVQKEMDEIQISKMYNEIDRLMKKANNYAATIEKDSVAIRSLKEEKEDLQKENIKLKKNLTIQRMNAEDKEQIDKLKNMIVKMTDKNQEVEDKLQRSMVSESSKVAILEKSNSYLKEKLKVNPSDSKLASAQGRIQELEKQLETSCRSQSSSREHRQSRRRLGNNTFHSESRRKLSTSRELKLAEGNSQQIKTLMPTYESLLRLMQSIEQTLDVYDIEDILPTIRSLQKSYTNWKRSKEFIIRITNMSQTIGDIGSNPSFREIWKWIRDVITQWSLLKKQKFEKDDNQHIVFQLLDVLGLVYPDDISTLKSKLHLFKNM